MSGNTVVQKMLIELMEDRINKVAWNKAMADENYVNADGKRNDIFNLLRESLSSDKQISLLGDLENAWNIVEGRMQEFAYRQGVQDSKMIHRELSEFGICVTKESISSVVHN